jgi:hypothetical protein
MHKILYVLAGAAVVSGTYRRIQGGQDGEVVSAITLLAACALLGAGAIVHAVCSRRRKD